MDLDQKLFGLLFRRAKALFGPSRQPPPPGAVPLTELAPRLEVLAGLVAGRRVDLRRLRLPERFESGSTSEENETIALARILRAALALRRGLVWSDEATRPLATLLAQPLLFAALEEELPGGSRLLDAADQIATRTLVPKPPEAESHLPSKSGRAASEALASLVAAAPVVLRDAQWSVPESWGLLPTPAEAKAALPEPPLHNGSGATGTEREGRRRRVRHIDLGEEKLDENPITHSFEKVHTAEEYRGGKKRTDGEDELSDHAEALDELDMNEVTRSGERAKSVYRAELEFEGSVGDVAGEAFSDSVPYDEWDASAGKYRESWCAVRERVLPSSQVDPAWAREILTRHASQLRAIRTEFARLEQTRVWRGRQVDGPEVDEDAMVDRHASLRSGHQPPDRLFCNRRRHERDLAVHLVVDASLSTDSWVANRRVLDVARDSLVLLAEALRTEQIPTSVAVFRSHTRRDCRFELVKDFDEDWTVVGPRLASLSPEGYTRIGPALRHATHRLEERGARRRLLVLVSDGKPTDYDRYEGRHGIADIARAVDEARRSDVIVHALAIDAVARPHLPRMFGRAGYEILPRPDALPRAMASLFTQLAQ